MRQLRHLGEVGHPDRAEHRYGGMSAVVQGLDEPIGDQRPHAGGATGEAVHEPQDRRAHDLLRRLRALADQQVLDQQPVVLVLLLQGNRMTLARGHPGGHPVHRRTGLQMRLHDVRAASIRSAASAWSSTRSRSRATLTTSSSVRSLPVRITVTRLASRRGAYCVHSIQALQVAGRH